MDWRRHDREGADAAASAAPALSRGLGAAMLRRAARQPRLVAASVLAGFAMGVAYRLLFNPPNERDFGNFLRSGLHGVGIGLTVWAVLTALDLGARSGFGASVRRLPLAAEVVIRALIMTSAFVVVGLVLQVILYAEPFGLRWLSRYWLTTILPSIVAIGFVFSLVIGVAVETQRLIGGELLTSVLLGTYHRPRRQTMIVMFLDLANSTRLAESLGEVRVHDLITRFFFDIDEPIGDFGGRVHAYVGDEVIVSWPVSDDPRLNARCVACFFAIGDKIGRLAHDYEAEFGVAPAFRAGLHAGPVVVSECGDAKRQLAYFGDTMNVAARLCDYCKTISGRLVVSSDLLLSMKTPPDLVVGEGEVVAVRGREKPISAHIVSAVSGEVESAAPPI